MMKIMIGRNPVTNLAFETSNPVLIEEKKKATTTTGKSLNEPTSDTIDNDEEILAFYTSTPKRLRANCKECRKYLFGIFTETGT
jgi:hypothetical protein